MEKHTARLSTALAATAAMTLVSLSSPASGETMRRVVVADFEGPREETTAVHSAIVEILDDLYEVVPYRKYRIERRRLGRKEKSKKRAIVMAARKAGCDAIVYAKIDRERMIVKVRDGGSGVVVGKFKLRLQGILSERSLEDLEDRLVDAIDATEPLSEEDADLVSRIGAYTPDSRDRLQFVTVDEPSGPSVSKKWQDVTDETEEDEKDSKPSPFAFHAAVGVAGRARSLIFNGQASLEENERPTNMRGSLAQAIAFNGVVDVKSLGISAELDFERSVGATISYREGAGSKQIGLKQMAWGLRAFIRREVRKRVTLRGGLGYRQHSFEIKDRPNGLRLPDTRYSYADIGAGVRVSLKDKLVAVTADAAYIHVFGISGLTDPKAYGPAKALGLRGGLGLDIDATESTFVRVAFRYSELAFSFDGTGELTTDLDDDPDVDVNSAVETYVGGVAMLGFHF